MRRRSLGLALVAALALPGAAARAADYAIGADLSFLKQAEERGTVFKDSGQAKPGLQTVLDEKQLAVTLMLNVVKMLPSK